MMASVGVAASVQRRRARRPRLKPDGWLGVVRPLERLEPAKQPTRERAMPRSTDSQFNLDFARSDIAPPLALTVPEAAALAGVSTRTMYRAIEAGFVPSVRLTPRGRVFVPRRALERFLAEGG